MAHCLRPEWLAYAFIGCHALCWALAPALLRHNLPLDAIEGSIWGHQLEWGYDKNPFLNGWLTALATYVGGRSGWAHYLFSQVSVAACMWCVYKVAKEMLSPLDALVALLVLEGTQYFNFHAIDFNDNTLELGLWALSSYFFYQACKKGGGLHWAATGLFAGLGMMAKYYTASLLASMGLLLLCSQHARAQLATKGPYVCFAVFVAILLPHAVWLTSHGFITVSYVFDRASNTPHWANHLVFPLQFSWQQLQAFLPSCLLYGALFIGKRPFLAPQKHSLAPFDKAYLFWIGLGPFVLTILLSALLGITLRAGWGMPLLSFWGAAMVALVKPRLSLAKLALFGAFFVAFFVALLVGYGISLVDSKDASSANFPGQEIANAITEEWQRAYHVPLAYVGGSRWLSGNVEFYSKDRPAVFIEWDTRRSPWIDIKDLERKGAVFLWDITAHEGLPPEAQKRFPRLLPPVIKKFNWHRNVHHLPPVQVGMAILPPQTSRS